MERDIRESYKVSESGEESSRVQCKGEETPFDLGKIKIPKGLRKLDLSTNLIFGRVPPTVATLSDINLRHNQLCGKLPELPPGRFYASDFDYNDCLSCFTLPTCKA